jgi:hypothetical protein
MTPAGFLITYPLAALTTLVAVRLRRRRSDSWRRSVLLQLVAAQPARFTYLSTESTATKRDDRSLGRRANENKESAAQIYVPVIAKVGQSTASEESLNFCQRTSGYV